MPTPEEHENYLEMFDVSTTTQVVKAPLTSIRFIPRVGERIFLSHHGPGNWKSYTVVNVEYFLGYDQSTGQAAAASASMSRISLYVEESK
jgi:hypothetical protein